MTIGKRLYAGFGLILVILAILFLVNIFTDNFAKPLIAKRHQVDTGDATVSDLQIFYLQKDPSSWLAKSSIVLDQSNADISKFLEQSTKSANNASTVSAIVTIGGTL